MQAARKGSKSPHKMVLRNKFRFYDEEHKYSETMGNEEDDDNRRGARQFSPITSMKTLGIRVEVDKSKTSYNLDA